MLRSLPAAATFILALAVSGPAQNGNTTTQTTRQRTTTATGATRTASSTEGQNANTQQAPASGTTTSRTRTQGGRDATAEGVVAAFDDLIEGIRRADVNAVTSVYWNSPQLSLFNYNGTVTRGWEQMRRNRESSYPELKDVKIEIRDRRVQLLGRDGAVVTCLWTQSQTYRGTPETATGRMTLVFRRVGNAWKAIHLHTSPDTPDPSRVPPSEQTTEAPAPKPTPKPKTTP